MKQRIILYVIFMLVAGSVFFIVNAEMEEESFHVRQHYSEYSGFMSSEEYVISFQRFREDCFFIRVSRAGFDTLEFEVTSYEEAMLFMESMK